MRIQIIRRVFKLMHTEVGRCTGLVVMGGDSCPEGCGFESQHRILDEHFSRIFVGKIAMFA